MGLVSKKGDMDTFNFTSSMCYQYPNDTITQVKESTTVSAGGQKLVLHSPVIPPLTTGVWSGICGPIQTGPAPPQPRVITSGVNFTVKANGVLIAATGDKTQAEGFTPRFLIGPGNIGSRTSIGG